MTLQIEKRSLFVCVCVGAQCVSGHGCRLESLTGCLFSFLSPSDRWQDYVRPLTDTNYCDRSPATTYITSDVSHIFDAGLIWTNKTSNLGNDGLKRCLANANLLRFIFSIRHQLSSTKWIQNVACSLPLFKAFCKSVKTYSNVWLLPHWPLWVDLHFMWVKYSLRAAQSSFVTWHIYYSSGRSKYMFLLTHPGFSDENRRKRGA